jgi:hypothetical protein
MRMQLGVLTIFISCFLCLQFLSVANGAEQTKVEVLYEGPTAAGGVLSPKDIISKELSDAGFDVLVTNDIISQTPPAASPRSHATPTDKSPVPAASPSPPKPDRSQSPAGLTVKRIFDFVRSVQQGKTPAPRSSLAPRYFLPAGFAPDASPGSADRIVVAIRCSLRRIRGFQGIFSTEAQMQIAVVSAEGKNLRSLVLMVGPDKARGFGNDWEQAEEEALRAISSKLGSELATKLRAKSSVAL